MNVFFLFFAIFDFFENLSNQLLTHQFLKSLIFFIELTLILLVFKKFQNTKKKKEVEGPMYLETKSLYL
jgi:hypothetical protein